MLVECWLMFIIECFCECFQWEEWGSRKDTTCGPSDKAQSTTTQVTLKCKHGTGKAEVGILVLQNHVLELE